MTEQERDTETTPVLFRMAKDGDGEYLTAVFPADAGTNDVNTMSCFAHVGQHGSCSVDWYRGTWPALPAQYHELARELEAAPYRYRLKIRQRMSQTDQAKRREQLR